MAHCDMGLLLGLWARGAGGNLGGGGVVFRTRQLNCIDLYCICTNTSASDL